VDAFYRLNCATRRHHGLPPQPHSFFEKIFDHVISRQKGFVALGTHAGRAVAGAVFFHFKGQCIYKYGASDIAARHLRPNNLVMWAAIKWACRSGMTDFHFGRTEPGNQGLLQFKRGWGASEEELSYYKYDLKKNRFLSNKSGPKSSYRVFKMMPEPLLRLTGNLLYRHVG
jgi:lipid II:glycine glycyltransferase (peptidoglycan interpeptide bridge formation enzyme)